jgi:hypothetical protein
LIAALALDARAQTMPIRSGLPWASGTSNAPIVGFGNWRGRPIDLYTTFHRKDTWDGINANSKVVPPSRVTSVVGFPMLPDSHRGQLRECAAGAFDAQMVRIRNTLLAHGWKGSWFRLGWGMNRVAGGDTGSPFPWAALVADQGHSYTRCFRRWAKVLNPHPTRNFTLVWQVSKVGSFPYPIEKLWPGSDVVQVVGTDGYDRCPAVANDAQWEADFRRRDRWNNPAGLGGWQAYARLKGRPLAIPEWAVGGENSPCAKPGFDNPYYIRKFFRWLGRNAGTGPGQVVYESYFDHVDGLGVYALFPPEGDAHPRSAAAYRELW